MIRFANSVEEALKTGNTEGLTEDEKNYVESYRNKNGENYKKIVEEIEGEGTFGQNKNSSVNTNARKIVEAELCEALNKNDSKAVREACIVLKAMDEEVNPSDGDAAAIERANNPEWAEAINASDANARGRAKVINECINELLYSIKFSKAVENGPDVKFVNTKFLDELTILVNELK